MGYIKSYLQKAALTKKGNLSELNLFRQMMYAFKNYYMATTIISETHQNYVNFNAIDPLHANMFINKNKEISDLHIITYSPRKKIARETFLQAKVARRKEGLQPNGDFTFHGDWFQYDLLSRRPYVTLPPAKKRPYHRSLCGTFLKNAVLPSIGSYGVFYKQNGITDFAYQPANEIICNSTNNSCISDFQMNTCLPTYANPKGIPDLQYARDVDLFEYAVTHNLCGSPIQWCPNCRIFMSWLHHEVYESVIRPWNSPEEIDRTIRGLDEFGEFVYENRDLFSLDGDENSEALQRYSELNRYTEYHVEGDGNGRGYNYQGNRDGEDDSELCSGSISLVLINTDRYE